MTSRRGGDTFSLTTGRHVLVDDPDIGPDDYSTMAGTDEATGTWEIVIPAIDYGMTNGEEDHLTGPWTLTVDAPMGSGIGRCARGSPDTPRWATLRRTPRA